MKELIRSCSNNYISDIPFSAGIPNGTIAEKYKVTY